MAASRMIQAAEGQDLETALFMAGQARRELGRCQARWDALPEPMRREQPVTDVVDVRSRARICWRSPTQNVGARISTDFAPVQHEQQLLSLKSVRSVVRPRP